MLAACKPRPEWCCPRRMARARSGRARARRRARSDRRKSSDGRNSHKVPLDRATRRAAGRTMLRASASLFRLVLIKPTHYDDDGYPIQWVKAVIPSNTLACLNGLAEDARQRQVLGPAIDIVLHTYDETNQRVRPDRIIHRGPKAAGRARTGLVEVEF